MGTNLQRPKFQGEKSDCMKNTSDNYRKSASYIKKDYYENYL